MKKPIPQGASEIKPLLENRIDNVSLHNLHTRWAVETLTIVRECQKRLSDLSRHSADHFSFALAEVMQAKVREDPAFRDAAAMIFAGIELSREE